MNCVQNFDQKTVWWIDSWLKSLDINSDKQAENHEKCELINADAKIEFSWEQTILMKTKTKSWHCVECQKIKRQSVNTKGFIRS